MQRLDDDQIEQILAMVDASAAAVAPDEREDSFDDYADLMRHEHVLPGTETQPVDPSAAGIADSFIFLGMGLAFLGQVAFNVLNIATDMAIERGVESAAAFLRRKIRKETDPDPAEEITRRILLHAELPPEVDVQELRLVITIQVTVIQTGTEQQPPTP
ncbi:hypothetical protein [Actinomadura meridiana]|uniref:hypothetical protein n=1 Tax=Actinomadura meridiana TaxID=559626 RepID=UPI0031E71C18